VADLTRLDNAVPAGRSFAARSAAVAVDRIPIIAALSGIEDAIPAALDGAAGPAAISGEVVTIVALLPGIEVPIPAEPVPLTVSATAVPGGDVAVVAELLRIEDSIPAALYGAARATAIAPLKVPVVTLLFELEAAVPA
jgi:hypothetical protein